MPTVTVIGSLNYDLVTYTNQAPGPGETLQAESFENHLGGKGLNEALAAARLASGPDTRVQMVGNVGTDTFGSELTQVLVDSGVDVEYIEQLEGVSSGVAAITVELGGENRILITPGANGKLKPSAEKYSLVFLDSQDGDFVMLQNEYPHTQQSIEWIRTNRPGLNVAYNPSPFKKELVAAEVLAKIDLLIVNEGEAGEVAGALQLSGEGAGNVDKMKLLASSLQQRLHQDNCSSVIVTMGSHGCCYASKAGSGYVPAQKVDNIVDTTGAGDTFFGGVVLQLVQNKGLDDAVAFATKASALAIQKKGAAEGIPWYKEVQKSDK